MQHFKDATDPKFLKALETVEYAENLMINFLSNIEFLKELPKFKYLNTFFEVIVTNAKAQLIPLFNKSNIYPTFDGNPIIPPKDSKFIEVVTSEFMLKLFDKSVDLDMYYKQNF